MIRHGMLVVCVCISVLGVLALGCGSEPLELAETAESATAAPASRPAVPPSVTAERSNGITQHSATATPYSQTIPSPRVITRTPTPSAVEEPVILTESINCGVFNSPEQAQETFLLAGGPFEDPYLLDTNGDGLACNADTDAGAALRGWVKAEPTVTPAPVAASPTPVRAAGETAVMYEPIELWEVDWRELQKAGVVHIQKLGERLIGGGDGLRPQFPYEICVPEAVGTGLDSSNKAWKESERLGWLWVDLPESDDDFCVVAQWSWDVDVFPVPSYPGNMAYDYRARSMLEPLVFAVAYEWRFYDTPPEDARSAGAFRYNQRFPEPVPSGDPAEPVVMVEVAGSQQPLTCGPEMMPSAIWTDEEGFIPLSIEEEMDFAELDIKRNVLSTMTWDEASVEAKKEADRLGWYFILGDQGEWPFFCWKLVNQEDLPDRKPCLECYERK